jgi:hypothetical protein
MHESDDPAERILQIENRQDEALRLLAELEQRVDQALAETSLISKRLAMTTIEEIRPLRAA